MTSQPSVDSDGNKHWKNSNGELHRVDGPAVERVDGSREWWVGGERHRLNGPAFEWVGGGKTWWVRGKLHRLDGPAVEGVTKLNQKKALAFRPGMNFGLGFQCMP